MDARPGRETPPPSAVEPSETTIPDQPIPDRIDTDDPELDAWLAARDAELAEMAWAQFDQIDDRSWQ